MSAVGRFWTWVNRCSESECWPWVGAMNEGYGVLSVDGRNALAHRFAYELLVGPIPAGLQIDHLCRVRHCVNPAHLEPVSSRENTLRGVGPTALNAAKTHCKYGHEFTPENTYERPNGRECRECIRIRCRRYRAARKAA